MHVACPACGEEDHLRGERGERGERGDDGVRVTCEACSHIWDRRPGASCSACGSDDVWVGPRAVVERSRGTQLSVVATTTGILCRTCDRDELAEHLSSPGGRMLMPKALPTTSGDEG